jgi:hypothetical protein
VRSNLPIQSVHLPSDVLQEDMIVGGQGPLAVVFQLPHFRLDRWSVDTSGGMVLERFDIQRAANCGQQVVLVHLGISRSCATVISLSS